MIILFIREHVNDQYKNISVNSVSWNFAVCMEQYLRFKLIAGFMERQLYYSSDQSSFIDKIVEMFWNGIDKRA